MSCHKIKIKQKALAKTKRTFERMNCCTTYSYKCQICGGLHLTTQDPEIRVDRLIKLDRELHAVQRKVDVIDVG